MKRGGGREVEPAYLGLLSLVDFGPIPGSADRDQAIKYGNPFSSSGAAWTEFVTMTYAAPVRIPTPQGIGIVSAMMVAALPVSSLAATGVIAPSISPVRLGRTAIQPPGHEPSSRGARL